MHLLSVRNVREALPRTLRLLREVGVQSPSRNGPVLRFPSVFAVEYSHPWERVLTDPDRDANPFFHLAESLWMLQGRNDLTFIQRFVSNFDQYSDDGSTLHGAYGHRWIRHWYHNDQISETIRALLRDPHSRRCVIQMWDPRVDDPNGSGKDYPCNLSCTVQIDSRGAVALTVFNRSNDIVFGMLGANAVHFSVLQEYIAAALNRPIGVLTQVSSNAHLYLQRHGDLVPWEFVYPYPAVAPMVDLPSRVVWDDEVYLLLQGGTPTQSPFLSSTALPMFMAHTRFKEGDRLAAYDLCAEIQEPDWRVACTEWIGRRLVD